jgi:nitrate/nitrite transporter NarK
VITLALIALLARPSAATGAPSRGDSRRLQRVLATRAIWPFNLTVLFAYGGYFSFITFLPSFLVTGMKLSRPEAGLVTALITAGTIVSWPAAGAISDRVGRRKPIYLLSQVASVATCIAFAVLVPRLGMAGAMVVALTAGVLTGGMILPFVMIIELFPAELAGTAAGVTNAACFVGGMVLPIILGRVVDVTGSFTAAFFLAAAVQGLALVSGLFLRETGAARV